MKKRIFYISVLVLIPLMFLSSHNWERVNYRNSTIFTAVVTIDGKPAKAGDEVGAFVNDECRMIATIFINNDTSYISSVIHGEVEENINFKVWIKETDSVIVVKDSLVSKPGESIYMHKIDAFR